MNNQTTVKLVDKELKGYGHYVYMSLEEDGIRSQDSSVGRAYD